MMNTTYANNLSEFKPFSLEGNNFGERIYTEERAHS